MRHSIRLSVWQKLRYDVTFLFRTKEPGVKMWQYRTRTLSLLDARITVSQRRSHVISWCYQGTYRGDWCAYESVQSAGAQTNITVNWRHGCIMDVCPEQTELCSPPHKGMHSCEASSGILIISQVHRLSLVRALTCGFWEELSLPTHTHAHTHTNYFS